MRLIHGLVVAALALASCGSPPHEAMVHVPAGRFRQGTDHGFVAEGPPRTTETGGYFIDRTEVTNEQFARFVAETGYVTDAERIGWSAVFDLTTGLWTRTEGADWRHPLGPRAPADVEARRAVVQVSWFDAVAFARWSGKRLPTEAEWERAARGGLDGAEFSWGDELCPNGRFAANYWQGGWPTGDTAEDGFAGIAEVGSYPANGLGLYDMAGNVWEWVEDGYAPYETDGASAGEPGERVIRGGSFLCSERVCAGFRVAARNASTPESATNHMGFRCAADE